ncbi:hypothetical protein H206_03154 [Candidatus Electrothrix aarhusensis]|uniref:Uncharacterized protein n=1 Tax=Candidatus Electrothrix aarhusensis TaxID=1859131 RepID=A0A3S3QHN0_9BACT|nr:hypothetical protein H206_03154 [Candidatus Electrothrix aarhusensis]
MDKIRILQPGTWLIKAEYEEPYSDQKVCDVESFSATLTLVIQWAGLHTGPCSPYPAFPLPDTPSFRSEDICPPTFLRNFLSARPLALSHSLPLKEVILTLCYAVREKAEGHKKKQTDTASRRLWLYRLSVTPKRARRNISAVIAASTANRK